MIDMSDMVLLSDWQNIVKAKEKSVVKPPSSRAYSWEKISLRSNANLKLEVIDDVENVLNKN